MVDGLRCQAGGGAGGQLQVKAASLSCERGGGAQAMATGSAMGSGGRSHRTSLGLGMKAQHLGTVREV